MFEIIRNKQASFKISLAQGSTVYDRSSEKSTLINTFPSVRKANKFLTSLKQQYYLIV